MKKKIVQRIHHIKNNSLGFFKYISHTRAHKHTHTHTHTYIYIYIYIYIHIYIYIKLDYHDQKIRPAIVF